MIREPRIVFLTVFTVVLTASALNVAMTFDYASRGKPTTSFHSLWANRVDQPLTVNRIFSRFVALAMFEKPDGMSKLKLALIASANDRVELNDEHAP